MLTSNNLFNHPKNLLPKPKAHILQFESPLQKVLQQNTILLNLLNKQNKWQFWLSHKPMLKRSWLKNAGLDEQKIVHLSNANKQNQIDIIEKAIISQKFSYVVACVSSINTADKSRLQIAVKSSGTHLFLVDDDFMNHDDFMTLSQQIMQKLH